MSNEARRRIADRVLERMRSRGFPLDSDAELMELIDRWCVGEMDMHDCHRQYLMAKERRRSGREINPLRDVLKSGDAPWDERELDWDAPAL